MGAIQSHQEFIAELEATRKKNSVEYRGYTIEQSTSAFGGYEFYPTAEGRDEDAEWDGDGWRNCGNVRFASTLEDAKDEIWEKVMSSTPQHKVVLNKRDYYFDWIEEAIAFAILWNAEEFHPGITA